MPGQIHLDHLHSVAFLYVKDRGTGQRTFAGTAFFIEMELPDRNGEVCYLISCHHVIALAKPIGQLYVRTNSNGGTSKDVPIAYSRWTLCQASDLAIATVEFRIDPETYKPIPFNWLATQDKIAKTTYPAFGIGTEVFYAGLFSGYFGKHRNYPVARFATIALMPPGERIPLNNTTIDGYLIETHSWGGYSGSPVFLYAPVNHPELSPWSNPPISQYSGMLLGVLHGHYPMKESVMVNDKRTADEVDINSGLAIVGTAQLLYDFLMSEEMELARKKIGDGIGKQRPQPTLDTSLLAHSVSEAAISEPLSKPRRTTKKIAKKAAGRRSN